MNLGEYIYDKELELFGKIIKVCSDNSGYVCQVVADKFGQKLKENTFVTGYVVILPLDKAIDMLQKEHRKAITNLESLKNVPKIELIKKVKKLCNDMLTGRVREDKDYDFDEWCHPMKVYLKRLIKEI